MLNTDIYNFNELKYVHEGEGIFSEVHLMV